MNPHHPETMRGDPREPTPAGSAARAVEALRSLHDGPEHLAEVVAFGDRAVPPLERLLRAPSESVDRPRSVAADALGLIGSPSAADALMRALADATERQLDPVQAQAEYVVVNRIAENLGDIGDPRAVGPLVSALTLGAYPACATALGRLRDSRAIPVLVERLHSDVTRETASDACRRFARDLVLPHLQRAVASGATPHERADRGWGRAAAVTLLAESGADEHVLRRALDDRADDVQQAAALALCARGRSDERVIAILVDALGSRAWWRADDAEEALAKIGDPAIAALQRVLADSPAGGDPNGRRRRRRTIEALGHIGGAGAIGALGAMAHDGDAAARFLALSALERLDDARAVSALAAFKGDSHPEIRQRAAAALAVYGAAAARELSAMIADRDRRVRHVAKHAISALGLRAVPVLRAAGTWRARALAWRLERAHGQIR